MRFEIHYTIENYEDSFFIEGETDEDCIKSVHDECEKRCLTTKKNDLWSMKIEQQNSTQQVNQRKTDSRNNT